MLNNLQNNIKQRVCICGCGKPVSSDKRHKYFDGYHCKKRWIQQQIEAGKLTPMCYNTCEWCGGEFPLYKEREDKKDRKTCGKSCQVKLVNHIKRHNGITDARGETIRTKAKEAVERRKAAKRKETYIHRRSTHCIRDGKQCTDYYNWGEPPLCFCECTGYKEPVEKERRYHASSANTARYAGVGGSSRHIGDN